MPHRGQEIKRANGFVLRIDTLDDDLLAIEARYRGDAPLAQSHYHPSQDEHFEVLEGTVRAVIDGEERRYSAGERFDIPAGTPHQMSGAGPARLHWEIRPALRMAEFFEVAYSDDPGDDFHERFAAEFRLTTS
jgi:mannose-6-phosphate isomerase-like protein (cupin superfamily)